MVFRIRVISWEVHTLFRLKRNKWKKLHTECICLFVCMYLCMCIYIFSMIVALICQASVFSSSLWVKLRCHCQYCNTYLIRSSGWQAFFNLLNFSHSLPGTAFPHSVHWTLQNNCEMILHASYFSAPSDLFNK